MSTKRKKILTEEMMEEMMDLGLDPRDLFPDGYELREADTRHAPLITFHSKGSSAKKKTKKKRPRGVGIASRGYGKAMK
jgi:hypothetical protein|tara:strand:- start:1141 stop:1377 length:237 start_codon:yes stop_codon:yes gene_type:complete